MSRKPLTDADREKYQWQLSVNGFGESGQEKLKNAAVLISRLGGVGGLVAYQLAAAGIGKLVVAHAGNVRPSDLNRQLLMTHDWLGKPRIESVRRRLLEFNPQLEVVAVAENIDESNVTDLVAQCDLIVDCAPLFRERFAMNAEAVRSRKPLVECAMFELEAQLTSIIPGKTPCLRCFVPEPPPTWQRQFPVFGAVSGTVACMAAMEAIKLIAGFGEPLLGRQLQFDLRDMRFYQLNLSRRIDCPCCAHLFAN